MLFIVTSFVIMLAAPFIHAQQKKPPGQKTEIQQMINELKNEIKELEAEIIEAEKNDPDEAAELKKDLQMLRSSLAALEKNNPAKKTTTTLLSKKEYDYVFEIPARDFKRIKKVSPAIKTNRQIAEYIQATSLVVDKMVAPEKKKLAIQLYNELKKSNPDSINAGNMASGIWILGDPYFALYLQLLACKEHPFQTDWLNNYAVMLTMTGAEEYALPILQRINFSFPKNSITLNNIGQAWYGLGDLEKAERYLDSSMMFIGNHSQAKLTKSLVEEKKGNKKKAGELIKESLEDGYCEDKEHHLEKLGFEPDGSYIRGTDEIKEEFLGLQQFINLIPAYPMSSAAIEKAEREWTEFREKIGALEDELDKMIEEFEPVHKKAIEEFKKGQLERRLTFSPVAKKYLARNMNKLIIPTMEEASLKPSMIVKEFTPDFTEVDAKRKNLAEKLTAELSLNEQCRLISNFLNYANEVRRNYNNAMLRFWKRSINTMAQYHKYYLTPTAETYQLTLMNLKKSFISTLRSLQYESWGSVNCIGNPESFKKVGALPYFEDIHCDNISEIWFPGIGKIIVNCHYMETIFDPYNPFSLDLKFKLKDDLLTGQHVGGSVTFGASKSVLPKMGDKDIFKDLPIKVDLKAKAEVTIEWDSNGISDVSAGIGLESKVGFKDYDSKKIKSLTIGGISQTFSLHAGPSTKLKSSFLN